MAIFAHKEEDLLVLEDDENLGGAKIMVMVMMMVMMGGYGRGGSSQDMQSFPLWGIGAKYAPADDEVVTYRVSQFDQTGNLPTLPHCSAKPDNLGGN